MMSATVLGFGQDIEVVGDVLSANQADQERRRIHEWLHPPDPFISHTIARSKYERLTNRWLLDSSSFLSWIQERNALLSIVGIPGSGKTILASSIIAELEEKYLSADSTVLYFYFEFSDRQKQSIDGCIASLILQLALISDNFSHVLNLYTDCGQGKRTPNLSELLNVLELGAKLAKKVYLVFDALDECAEEDVMMRLISEQLHSMHGGISTLITSRKKPELDIDGFNGLIVSINVQQDLIDPDIQTCIRTRLAHNTRLARWCKDEKLRREIESTLMAGANGM